MELFAGIGVLSSYLKRRGLGVVTIDWAKGSHFNLAKPHILKRILGWIRGGCVHLVWLGTPCTSWSRARRGPPGSAWAPIRNNQHVLGFPELPPRDQEKIEAGNRTAEVSAQIVVFVSS